MRTTLLLALFAAAPAALRAQDMPATQPAAVELQHVHVAGFGLAFDVPPEWRRARETSQGQLALFHLPRDAGEPGILSVGANPSRGVTARALLTELAPKLGGTVDPAPLKWGELDVTRMNLAPRRLGDTGRAYAFAAHRDVVLVMVNGGGDAVERALASSLRLVAPRRAVEDLAPNVKPPTVLLDGALTLDVPEAYRPAAKPSERDQLEWLARDWPSGRQEAGFLLRAFQLQAGRTVGDVAAELSASMPRDNRWKGGPLAFAPAGPRGTLVSQPVEGAAGDSVRVAIVPLANRLVVQLVFRADVRDRDRRAAYDAAAERIAGSAR